MQKTYVLAFGEGMNHIVVSHRMMNLFKSVLPAEASRAAFESSRPNATRVELSYPTYSIMAEAVRKAAAKAPICP